MKKTVAILLCLVMTLALIPFSASAVEAEGPSVYNGTPGTSLRNVGDTYYIDSAADLAYFATTLNTDKAYEGKTVLLTTDIVWNAGDASTFATTAPANVWQSASTAFNGVTNGFAGTFDGQGHTVSGLYINAAFGAAQSGLGMFNVIVGGTVKNLVIKNSYATASTTYDKTGLGILCGAVKNGGTFSNIYVDAILEMSTKVKAGGIIGYGDSGNLTMTDCMFVGSLTSTSNGQVGGFIGSFNPATATDVVCTISNSISTGYVAGTGATGGFMVQNDCNVVLSKCIRIGSYGSSGSKDPLVKKQYGTKLTVSADCYWVQTNSASDYGTKVNLADLQGNTFKTTASTFDMTNWDIRDGNVPILKIANATEEETNVVSTYDGTASASLRCKDGVYYIDSAADLAYFLSSISSSQQYNGKTVKLTCDIVWNTGDASTFATTAPTYEWIYTDASIANDIGFRGTFDGQGHSVSGIYANRSVTVTDQGDIGTGFFSTAGWGATIQNLAIVNSYMAAARGAGARSYGLGAVVGASWGSLTFNNIYVDAILVGGDSNHRVGGIQGQVVGGGTVNFTDCMFAGNVTLNGTDRAGGILGAVFSTSNGAANINNCVVTGNVISKWNHGGILGHNSGATATIKKCLMTGSLGTETGDKDAIAMGTVTAENNFYVQKNATSTLGTATTVDALKGEGAKTVLTGFDFTNWYLNENGAPTLKLAALKTSPVAVPALAGLQLKDNGDSSFDLRFAGIIDSLDYSKLIYTVKVTYGGQSETVSKEVTAVNTAMMAGSETVTAESLGAAYLSLVTVSGLKSTIDMSFEVTITGINADGVYLQSAPVVVNISNGAVVAA